MPTVLSDNGTPIGTTGTPGTPVSSGSLGRQAVFGVRASGVNPAPAAPVSDGDDGQRLAAPGATSLPYTGAPIWLAVFGGGMLILAGVSLRHQAARR
jgi:hypothetical protein